MPDKQFSLVSTVFNEAKRLEVTIQDLESQTLQPNEIIITDAGSNDGTIEILEKWKRSSSIPIKIIVKPRCNVAEGRNLAIKESSYDIIVSTDFGCRFDKNWLQSLLFPFGNEMVEVVGGAFTVIEADQITLAAKAAYIVNNGYNIDVNAKWFIPSSRSIAYRKKVFDKIGGYCEWLTLAADDFVFGKEILANNYKIFIVDKPYVFWGRHTKFLAYKKEAERYGLGDGEAMIAFFAKIKNLAQVFMRLFFVLSLVFFIINTVLGFKIIVPLIGMLVFSIGFRQYYIYVVKPWLRFCSKKYSLKTLWASFYLFEIVQFAYLKSYFKGYFFSSDKIKNEAKALAHRLNK